MTYLRESFAGTVGGLGAALCLVTGLICAVYRGVGPGSMPGDPMDLREHWRGALQAGLALMVVGVLGGILLN